MNGAGWLNMSDEERDRARSRAADQEPSYDNEMSVLEEMRAALDTARSLIRDKAGHITNADLDDLISYLAEADQALGEAIMSVREAHGREWG